MEEFKTGFLKRTAYLPLRLATRFAARRAARVIVPDRAMVGEVERYLGVGEDRALTLPLAIDLEAIDRAVAVSRDKSQAADALPPGLPVLLSVGRLEANKGFELLVDALAAEKERFPSSWAWLLVGSGPREQDLRTRVHARSLSHHVRFLGGVPDDVLVGLYQRADLFVHPTLYEGSSLVTLEAMAHARPVVATSVGGIPDKVVDGVTGFLVPPGSPEALGAALAGALATKNRLAEMGRAGRKKVEEEFSWSARVRRLIALYREVVAREEAFKTGV
jgi:glycosyltransferase involved in cell wall biosynthesis